MNSSLRVQSGGAGTPTLLLLHGLGATGDVWTGLRPTLERHWPGRWLAPDLPGHGGSAPLDQYRFERLAEAIAPALPTGPIAVLGHSLGGVVALVLAGGSESGRVTAVCGLGIKVGWTADELARAEALAGRPNPRYPTRNQAAERYLKVAGLTGLVTPSDVPEAALVERNGEWTLAFDPRAFGVGAPDMAGLLAAARVPVILAAGERDPMSPESELRRLIADPMILPGLGHNAHVERPEALALVLARLAQ